MRALVALALACHQHGDNALRGRSINYRPDADEAEVPSWHRSQRMSDWIVQESIALVDFLWDISRKRQTCWGELELST